jgi:peptidoglycan/LPS O-acetylase OafA/YrhL
VIFGLAFFAPSKAQAVWWVTLALLLVGPRIAVLFPLWLLGVALYRLTVAHPVSARMGAVAFSASLLLYIAYVLYGRQWLFTHDLISVWVGEKFLPNRYVVAGIFALNLWGAAGLSQRPVHINATVERWVRRCAAMTFTVYLVHLPVAKFLSVISPWPPAHGANRALMLVGTGAAIVLMAQVSEQRKRWWADRFRTLLSPRQPGPRDAPVA